MSDQPTELRTYEMLVAEVARERRERHANLRANRTSPWLMGAYASGALVLPFAVIAGLWWLIAPYDFLTGTLAIVGGVACLPITLLVLLGVYDRARFEHQYLVTARDSLTKEPALPALPVSTGGNAPARESVTLKPGIIANGRVVARAPELSPAKQFLKDACLKLCRAGKERGSYSRSTLAEGPDAPMRGDEWDAASPWLQEHGYFYVKAGKGGGLLPAPGKDVDETIKLLEVAL